MKKDAIYITVIIAATWASQAVMDKFAPEFIESVGEFLKAMAHGLLPF